MNEKLKEVYDFYKAHPNLRRSVIRAITCLYNDLMYDAFLTEDYGFIPIRTVENADSELQDGDVVLLTGYTNRNDLGASWFQYLYLGKESEP